MVTRISLHDVTEMVFSDPHEVDPDSNMGWARRFTIVDGQAHKTELTLFAEDRESLMLVTIHEARVSFDG